jgi:cell division septum initiation protein DivIVA
MTDPGLPPVPSDDPARQSPYDSPEVEHILRQLTDIIEAARPVVLSASSMINKDEVLELLYECTNLLPDELRAARWLLKEREDFLARVRREGDELMDLARTRAERMVQRTEVVKSAETRARQIIDGAEAESRRLKMESEDYCDQKLGSFEAVLERTLKIVADGRARLQGDPLADLAAAQAPQGQPEPEAVADFYNQDDSGELT